MSLAFLYMDDHKLEEQKRKELYRDDPTCSYCGDRIKEDEDMALALFYADAQQWKLVHIRVCSYEAVMAENRRRAGAAVILKAVAALPDLVTP